MGVRAWVVCVALVLGLPAGAGAQPDREDFEERVRAELRAQDPEAATLFREGFAAQDRGDLGTAAARYRAVTERLPGSAHGWRRLCGVLLAEGALDEARAHCERALELADAPENAAALARVLVAPDPPRAGDVGRARALVERAVAGAPDQPWAHLTALEVYLAQGDLHAAGRASRRLEALAPDDAVTWYFAAIVAASGEDWTLAREHVERARARGMPDDVCDGLLARIDEVSPFYAGLWPTTWRIGAGWLGGLLLLLLLGAVLSGATMRAARRLPSSRDGSARGMSSVLRRSYAAVLWLACAYYYVSIPLVLLAVVGIFGGLVYAFFAIGRIPIKLVLIIVVVGGVTVWAILKSFFVRARDEDPGDRLELAAHPRLRETLEEVAREVGTGPVDTVFLTPGSDIAVFERGGLLRQLRGATERCLILGLGVLEGMDLQAFKAILAHEYGHFVNRDTAGGGFALAVRRSLTHAAIGLIEGGAAGWYNPAWWFLSGFHKVFLRISHGASRLQEILADRWAAFAYGARAFERGLRHVVAQSVRFDAHTNVALQEAVDGHKALVNLYRAALDRPVTREELDEVIEEALARPASAYDSHPAPTERFALVHALGLEERDHPDAQVPVWSLFADRERLELRMTEQIRENVFLSTGIHIAGDGPGEDRSAA